MSWEITRGVGPLVTAAIHAGHQIRPEIKELFLVDEQTRLREEDPFTDRWTEIATNRVIVNTSRFEVDLNRPEQSAVYMTADDAWGIDVWKTPPPTAVVNESLCQHRLFYAEIERFLNAIHLKYGDFVVLDLHSYCHRRSGPGFLAADLAENPDINIGTGSVDKRKWSSLVSSLISKLRAFDLGGQRLDVRENVKFRGGHFSSWINSRYAGDACAIAIEVKKTFMDEWTGNLDWVKFELISRALESTVLTIYEELRSV